MNDLTALLAACLGCPQTDVLVRPRRRRYAVYTRVALLPELADTIPLIHAHRTACERGVQEFADEGAVLVGATYDDVVTDEGAGELPAFERLAGHVEAQRIDVVMAILAQRRCIPVDALARQMARLTRAGAKVHYYVLTDGGPEEPGSSPAGRLS